MEWAALIAWVVTAGGGFVLLAIWLSRGGMQEGREPGSRIRPPLILSHFLLAATGLVIWIIYIATDSDALAWIALGMLAVVALLGFTMFAIWYQRRQRGAVREAVDPGTPAEQTLSRARRGTTWVARRDDRRAGLLDRNRRRRLSANQDGRSRGRPALAGHNPRPSIWVGLLPTSLAVSVPAERARRGRRATFGALLSHSRVDRLGRRPGG